MDTVEPDPTEDVTGNAAAADPTEGQTEERPGRTPLLALDGFGGSLAHLLTLARAQQIDLARLSVRDLIDQLAAAVQQSGHSTPLSEKADWVVMAAWLLLLRSRLLLPAETSAQQVAENEADEFRDRLIGLQAMQALAAWLDHRPQLGRDVFARGQPEYPGTDVNPGWQVDVVAFLWASLALFDDDTIPGLARTYRPQPWDLHTVEAARERILRRLAEAPDGMPLERLLPSAQSTVKSKEGELRWRSAWASTLVASLELAKQGDVVLTQTGDFQDIQVSAKAGRPAAEGQ